LRCSNFLAGHGERELRVPPPFSSEPRGHGLIVAITNLEGTSLAPELGTKQHTALETK
jgi:hypothetical protein